MNVLLKSVLLKSIGTLVTLAILVSYSKSEANTRTEPLATTLELTTAEMIARAQADLSRLGDHTELTTERTFIDLEIHPTSIGAVGVSNKEWIDVLSLEDIELLKKDAEEALKIEEGILAQLSKIELQPDVVHAEISNAKKHMSEIKENTLKNMALIETTIIQKAKKSASSKD